MKPLSNRQYPNYLEKKLSYKSHQAKRFKSIQLKSKKTLNIPYIGRKMKKNTLSYQNLYKKCLKSEEFGLKKLNKSNTSNRNLKILSSFKNPIIKKNSISRNNFCYNNTLEKHILLKIKNLKNKNFLMDPKNIFLVLTNLGENISQLMIHLIKKSDSKKIKVLNTIVNKLFSPSKKINFLLFNYLQKSNYSMAAFKRFCFFLLFFSLKKKNLFYKNVNIKYNEENFDNLFFNDLKRVSIFLKEKIKEINNKNLIYLNNKKNNSISKIKKLQKIRHIKSFTNRNLDKHYKAPGILTNKFFYQFQESKNLFADYNLDDLKYKLILDYNHKLKKFIDNSFHQIRKNEKLFN